MAEPDALPAFGFRTDGERLDRLRGEIVDHVRDRVAAAEADGVAVAMSGGIDSTLAATLAVEALGPDAVYGLVLPARKTDDPEQFDAHAVADGLGIAADTVHLGPLMDAFEAAAVPEVSADPDRVSKGNALVRLRAAVAYFAANERDLLVCGTTNRTEYLLGYFTKYGDGAADLRPLAGCYKTEVRALAALVDVPGFVREKEPTAGLWAGQVDAEELGAPYELIDCILAKLVDDDLGVEGTAAELGLPVERVDRFARMHLEAAHKRSAPPRPGDGDPDEGLFHELEARFE